MGSHLRLLEKENTMKIALPLAIVAGLGSAGPQFYGYRPLPYTAFSPVQGRKFSGNVNLGPGASITWGARGSLTDNIVPTGTTGNYAGKQAAKVVVQASAESALAYMRAFLDKDDLCGASGLAYMESILSGKTGAEANADAEAAYKDASEAAFKSAYSSGDDSILTSALAFVKAWPGVKSGNPCAVSGLAYMEAIVDGKSEDDAGYLSAKAFIKAFGDIARAGKSIDDPACAAAAKSFITAANPPDSASAESAKAFIDATLSTDFEGYDPVCAASALAYMDAFAAGKDALTSNLIAAKAFYEEYAKGNSPGTNSPCVKATLAYASKSPLASSANSDAMIAFINQAVEDGVGADPVCAAATIAFLDAKIAKKSDKEAGAASSEAYIEAFAANGGKRSEACKKSAEAYIKTF